MLPSKMMPTISAFLFTTGLPELPPMMSGVETMFSGVSSLNFDFALIQVGKLIGLLFPCLSACSNAPPIVVKNGSFVPAGRGRGRPRQSRGQHRSSNAGSRSHREARWLPPPRNDLRERRPL